MAALDTAVVRPERGRGAIGMPFWRSRAIRRRLTLAFTYVVLVVLGIAVLMPFFWMLSSSLKSRDEIFLVPPTWIPSKILWQNYPEALNYMHFPVAFRNTVVITLFATLGSLISSSLVGYSFAKVRFRGKDLLFMLCLSTLMIPSQVTMIPRYILFKLLHWLNTFLPLTVPTYFGDGPFYIFLLRQFFMTIPNEIDDAARIDGCDILGTFYHIALPLSKPGLAAVVIFSFFWNWNNFMEPLIYLSNSSTYPLAVALRFFQLQHEIYWSWLMAASVVTMLPCILLFFFAQKYFIQGVVVSGVKG